MELLSSEIMSRRLIKLAISFILSALVSCNLPDTVVTNIVHEDGSITRKVEMRNFENKFDYSDVQVPLDSTWNVSDSLEITSGDDTVWVRRAEKFFKNTDEINRDYMADSSANKEVSRRTEFTKRFKWFNTVYRFAEIIDNKMQYGYPVEEFLNQDELRWFFSPEYVNAGKRNGPDSLMFRSFSDTVEKKIENWTIRSLISEWIAEFARLTSASAGSDLSRESLQDREDEFVKIIGEDGEDFDSLWSDGILLRKFLGETNALEYKAEADSAAKLAVERVWIGFNGYSTRAVIPGKLTGTNGFIDTTGVLLWQVKSDFFLTQPYEMWAESKVPNVWFRIVTGLFLLFVLTGILIRGKK